jgi:hypothetical protein
MSCDICGKNNCIAAFHSVGRQQAYDDAINSDKNNFLAEIATLREQLKDCSAVVDRQQKMLDRNAEQIAILRNALSRLVEVHDAMGGKCGTVRIAAEKALLGKAQSEYICTCGIRVTPHKCPTNNGF